MGGPGTLSNSILPEHFTPSNGFQTDPHVREQCCSQAHGSSQTWDDQHHKALVVAK